MARRKARICRSRGEPPFAASTLKLISQNATWNRANFMSAASADHGSSPMGATAPKRHPSSSQGGSPRDAPTCVRNTKTPYVVAMSLSSPASQMTHARHCSRDMPVSESLAKCRYATMASFAAPGLEPSAERAAANCISTSCDACTSTTPTRITRSTKKRVARATPRVQVCGTLNPYVIQESMTTAVMNSSNARKSFVMNSSVRRASRFSFEGARWPMSSASSSRRRLIVVATLAARLAASKTRATGASGSPTRAAPVNLPATSIWRHMRTNCALDIRSCVVTFSVARAPPVLLEMNDVLSASVAARLAYVLKHVSKNAKCRRTSWYTNRGSSSSSSTSTSSMENTFLRSSVAASLISSLPLPSLYRRITRSNSMPRASPAARRKSATTCCGLNSTRAPRPTSRATRSRVSICFELVTVFTTVFVWWCTTVLVCDPSPSLDRSSLRTSVAAERP
mmetsp:Transcript_8226/g.34916  ORF Transcript_8226/g.34916 Transcript_8226/m.34916 type:complete len:454 (-) Transcript_8226:3368-4729(-)